MSQNNIDYLFQVFAPTADRSLGGTHISDDWSAFGDHLTQASSPTANFARAPGRSSAPADHSSTENSSSSSLTDRDEPQRNSEVNDSTSRDDDEQASGLPAVQDQHVENSGDVKATDNEADDDQQDTNESEENGIAASIGVAQAVDQGDSRSVAETSLQEWCETPKVSPRKDQTGAAVKASLKEGADDDATSAEAPAGDPVADALAATVGSDEAAVFQADDAELQSAVVKEPAAETNSTIASQERESSGESNIDATSKRDETGADNPAATIEASEASAELTEQIEAQAQAKASANARLTSPIQSEETEDSSDKPRRGSKTTDRPSSRSDAAAQVNKSVNTAIANAAVASVADATTGGGAAGEAKDQETQPVTAKAPPPVTSLERTARANASSRGNRADGPNDMPRIDPARFVGRVAKAFQTAHERGGTLQLRLNPPELGALRLELTVKDGVMSATLEADNAGARRVLLDHLPALRERLAEQNIRVERFDVDVRRDSNGGQTDPRGANQQPHDPSDRPEPRRQAAMQQRVREVAPTEAPAIAQRISSTGINLVV